MQHRKILLFLTLTLFFLCVLSIDAYAGPGGKIAKVMFETFWGKVLLVALVIIFLPFIIYRHIREYFKVRRTMATLQKLGANDRNFDWMFTKNRLTDVFTRVHRAWSNEEMADVSDFVTSWYWQNQQYVFLDRWRDSGQVNVSNLHHIISMKPLFVRHSGKPGGEESLLVVGINANVEDYLMERNTGLLLEGKKGFRDVENIWTFELIGGQWLLNNIEQLEFWSSYIAMPNEVPAVALQTEKA